MKQNVADQLSIEFISTHNSKSNKLSVLEVELPKICEIDSKY